MNKIKTYALYKGDEFIDIGTTKELAEKIGVSETSIRFYSTPTYVKRNRKGNCYVVVRIDDEEETNQ